MNKQLKAKLERAGWRVGDAQDFLELTPQEVLLLQLKESLGGAVREMRTRHQITQAELAKRMHSSQARVARIEGADTSVSLDLMLQALLASGASRAEVNRALRV